MALDSTTAGMNTLSDPNSAAPPAIGPAAPATTPALISGGQDQLGTVAPPISGGGMLPYTGRGVSPSMRDQLAAHIGKTSNDLMASNPNPDAPMGWAKSWVAGAQSALAGLSAIKPLPEHEQSKLGAAFYQLGNVAKANQEQQQQQQARADRLKQQKIENLREDQKLAIDKAHTQALTVATQQATARLSDEDQEKHIAAGKLAAEPFKAHHQQVADGITEDELVGEIGEGKKYDHTKYHAFQTGSTQVEKNGKLITEPTYSIFASSAEPVTVDKEQAEFLNKYLGLSLPTDSKTPMDGDVFDNQMTRALAAQTTTNLINAQARKENLAELEDKGKTQTMNDRITVAPFLGVHADDPISALGDLAEQKGPDGKPTDPAQAAQRLLSGWDPKEMETHRHNVEVETEKKVADAAKNSHNKDLATGNTDLTGDAYLASIPNKGEAALVKSIGEGLVEPDRMEYLIARNPGLMQDLSLAYSGRGLDTTKFHGYLDAVKKYTTDTKIAGQLNSARVGFRHLKALYDDNNTPGAFIAGTKAYAQRDVDLTDASKELARFLTGGTAPSKDEIKSAEDSLNPSILSFDPQASRQTAVKAQADRIREKVEEYRSQWRDALPNPNWARPMPGWSQDAQNAMDYIHYDGKPPITQPESSALPSGTEVKNSATPQTFTVPIPGPGNQVAHFATQAQADQFQAELARQVQRLNNAQ